MSGFNTAVLPGVWKYAGVPLAVSEPTAVCPLLGQESATGTIRASQEIVTKLQGTDDDINLTGGPLGSKIKGSERINPAIRNR